MQRERSTNKEWKQNYHFKLFFMVIAQLQWSSSLSGWHCTTHTHTQTNWLECSDNDGRICEGFSAAITGSAQVVSPLIYSRLDNMQMRSISRITIN
jgi:hypothetical protein